MLVGGPERAVVGLALPERGARAVARPRRTTCRARPARAAAPRRTPSANSSRADVVDLPGGADVVADAESEELVGEARQQPRLAASPRRAAASRRAPRTCAPRGTRWRRRSPAPARSARSRRRSAGRSRTPSPTRSGPPGRSRRDPRSGGGRNRPRAAARAPRAGRPARSRGRRPSRGNARRADPGGDLDVPLRGGCWTTASASRRAPGRSWPLGRIAGVADHERAELVAAVARGGIGRGLYVVRICRATGRVHGERLAPPSGVSLAAASPSGRAPSPGRPRRRTGPDCSTSRNSGGTSRRREQPRERRSTRLAGGSVIRSTSSSISFRSTLITRSGTVAAWWMAAALIAAPSSQNEMRTGRLGAARARCGSRRGSAAAVLGESVRAAACRPREPFERELADFLGLRGSRRQALEGPAARATRPALSPRDRSRSRRAARGSPPPRSSPPGPGRRRLGDLERDRTACRSFRAGRPARESERSASRISSARPRSRSTISELRRGATKTSSSLARDLDRRLVDALDAAHGPPRRSRACPRPSRSAPCTPSCACGSVLTATVRLAHQAPQRRVVERPGPAHAARRRRPFRARSPPREERHVAERAAQDPAPRVLGDHEPPRVGLALVSAELRTRAGRARARRAAAATPW